MDQVDDRLVELPKWLQQSFSLLDRPRVDAGDADELAAVERLWHEIVRAAFKNFVAGHVRQGASTITQQLARNSFALKEKTYRRKLLEIYLAERIEQNYDKQKIMELYLNRIYFGGGLYGAEAAARGYFDKPAREMSLVECATLAGVIRSPNRLSPWSDRATARESRNVALARMRDLGFIDRQQLRRGPITRCRHWQSTERAGTNLRGRLHPAEGD